MPISVLREIRETTLTKSLFQIKIVETWIKRQKECTFPYLPKRFFKSAALVLEESPLTQIFLVELPLLPLVLLVLPRIDSIIRQLSITIGFF